MSKKPALRINEALDFHEQMKSKGEASISRMELADVFFEGSQEATKKVNMSNLARGRTKRVDPNWVKVICKRTGVDANFLFGIKPMNPKKLEKYEKGCVSNQ